MADTDDLRDDDSPPPADAAADGAGEPATAAGNGQPSGRKNWYVVKVQSGREDSIKEALERRVKIEGLENYLGQIVIPVEKETQIIKGRKVTRTKKLYPGYLFVEVEFNDRILYLFRETAGVGDFVGATGNQAPPPMAPHEVERILLKEPEVGKPATLKIKFDKGERVKIKDGMFAGMEGEISEILEAKGLVRVMIQVFGRAVPVELEYWQVEHV